MATGQNDVFGSWGSFRRGGYWAKSLVGPSAGDGSIRKAQKADPDPDQQEAHDEPVWIPGCRTVNDGVCFEDVVVDDTIEEVKAPRADDERSCEKQS